MHSVIKLSSTLTGFHLSQQSGGYPSVGGLLEQHFDVCDTPPVNKRLVLPVLWCSSHTAGEALGNWTLWSTLINDGRAPQTPCRRLMVATVKAKHSIRTARRRETKIAASTQRAFRLKTGWAGPGGANTHVVWESHVTIRQSPRYSKDPTLPACREKVDAQSSAQCTITCCSLLLGGNSLLAGYIQHSARNENFNLSLLIYVDSIWNNRKDKDFFFFCVKDTSSVNSRDLEVI